MFFSLKKFLMILQHFPQWFPQRSIAGLISGITFIVLLQSREASTVEENKHNTHTHSTAATRTLKLSTTLLSISCGIRLIFFLMISCLRIVLTNSAFQVSPKKIVMRVEIFGIGYPGVIGLPRNESGKRKVMPEVLKCSVREMSWR